MAPHVFNVGYGRDGDAAFPSAVRGSGQRHDGPVTAPRWEGEGDECLGLWSSTLRRCHPPGERRSHSDVSEWKQYLASTVFLAQTADGDIIPAGGTPLGTDFQGSNRGLQIVWCQENFKVETQCLVSAGLLSTCPHPVSPGTSLLSVPPRSPRTTEGRRRPFLFHRTLTGCPFTGRSDWTPEEPSGPPARRSHRAQG